MRVVVEDWGSEFKEGDGSIWVVKEEEMGILGRLRWMLFKVLCRLGIRNWCL